MSTISFEQLPEMVAKLIEEVGGLKELIDKKIAAPVQKENGDEWMNLNELMDYLPDKPSKSTVYSWVCNRSIPFHKKTKKLSFSKAEIDAWLKNLAHATTGDMKDVALETLGYRKGGQK